MELVLRVKHTLYFVNSDHKWFADTSYPVLHNAYHYILVDIYPNSNHVELIGTKNPNKSFIVDDKQFVARVKNVFTYVLYFN